RRGGRGGAGRGTTRRTPAAGQARRRRAALHERRAVRRGAAAGGGGREVCPLPRRPAQPGGRLPQPHRPEAPPLMRSPVFLALKDLRLLVRDRLAFVWTLGIPLMFALFFGTLFGGGRGGGGMRVAVVDEDDSPASRALVARLEQSPSLRVSRTTADEA